MKAFPNPHAFNAESAQLGMNLRDYFAAKAMQEMVLVWLETENVSLKMVVKDAYKVADAMMEEREEKK